MSLRRFSVEWVLKSRIINKMKNQQIAVPEQFNTVNIPIRINAVNKNNNEKIMVLSTNVVDHTTGKLKVLYIVDDKHPMMTMDLTTFNDTFDIVQKE